MARRTRKEAEATRQQILDNAVEAFSVKGYARTTFVDIAERIGLTKGAVYWHFKSKTDLLVALIDYRCSMKCSGTENPSKMAESLATLRSSYVESARQVLREPLMRQFEFFINFQIEWSVEMLSEVRNRLASLREDPMRKYTFALKRLQENGELPESLDCERVGTLMLSTWIGLMRLVLLGRIEEQELPKLLEISFDALIRDISNKEQVS